jgi:hypothetical protein
MFGLKKRGPTRPFTHGDNCKILKADPTVQIRWSEVETGHWRADCQCGSEDVYEEPAVVFGSTPMTRPLFRHAGQCEHRYTSDPALLRAVLMVRDGAARATGGWSAARATRLGTFRTAPRASVDDASTPTDVRGRAESGARR